MPGQNQTCKDWAVQANTRYLFSVKLFQYERTLKYAKLIFLPKLKSIVAVVLSEMTIRQIHLSLIRTFSYSPCDALKKSFNFLGDVDAYYNTVLAKCKYLGEQNTVIPNVGKLRAITDVAGKKTADYFFDDFRTYYQNMAKSDINQLRLTQHFPCAIDILPAKGKFYKFDLTALPESMKKASEGKMSFSVRLYPAGLASFRLGYFLKSQDGFAVKDIIEFLSLNQFPVTVNDAEFDLREYAINIVNGIHQDQAAVAFTAPYSIVDIIESSVPLTWEQNSQNVFLPLLCLNSSPPNDALVSENLAKDQEIFRVGPKSTVFYFPSAKEVDHKNVRRLLRNYLELLFVQKFLTGEITALAKTAEYSFDMSGNWKQILKNGLKEPKIRHLFSLWDYTSLQQQNDPLKKKEWRDRYSVMLKVLDKENSIENGSQMALETIKSLVDQGKKAQSQVSSGIEKAIDLMVKVKGVLTGLGGSSSGSSSSNDSTKSQGQ